MKFGDVGVEPGTVSAHGRTLAFQKRVASASKCLASAEAALAGFVRGAHIFGFTKGQFSMIDLAAAVLGIVGPADVSLWTWAIADYEAEAFGAFFRDGRVKSLRVVLDWSASQRNAALVGELQERFGLEVARITKTHAKVVTVSTAGPDGWRVVIRGSMNLNFNPRFEQFDVSDDAAVFQVVADLERELLERGKPLPVAKLRHQDAAALLNAGEVENAPPAWAEMASGKQWW
jgi:hypothetical protein